MQELTKEHHEALAEALYTSQVELGDSADFLAELASRGLKIVPAEKWRPIETAPKDGTRVILWLGKVCQEARIARWFAPWGCWIDGDLPNEEDEFGIGANLPTHWQPLPAAPETAGERG